MGLLHFVIVKNLPVILIHDFILKTTKKCIILCSRSCLLLVYYQCCQYFDIMITCNENTLYDYHYFLKTTGNSMDKKHLNIVTGL